VAAAVDHTVLLRSDGAAVACGDDQYGQCNIPVLADGVAYTHVAATGFSITLFMSDGNAAICGHNDQGPCIIPALPRGVTYVHFAQQMVLTFHCCDSHATFCSLNGTEVCRFEVDASDTLVNIREVFRSKMMTEYGKYCVVLPNGELLSAVCAQAPSAILEPFLERKRMRRN